MLHFARSLARLILYQIRCRQKDILFSYKTFRWILTNVCIHSVLSFQWVQNFERTKPNLQKVFRLSSFIQVSQSRVCFCWRSSRNVKRYYSCEEQSEQSYDKMLFPFAWCSASKLQPCINIHLSQYIISFPKMYTDFEKFISGHDNMTSNI